MNNSRWSTFKAFYVLSLVVLFCKPVQAVHFRPRRTVKNGRPKVCAPVTFSSLFVYYKHVYNSWAWARWIFLYACSSNLFQHSNGRRLLSPSLPQFCADVRSADGHFSSPFTFCWFCRMGRKENQPNSTVSLDATNKPLQMDTFNKYEPAFSSRRWWDGVSSLWQIINLAEWKLIYEAVRLPTILFHRMAVLLVNRKDASRKHGHSKQTRLLLSIMTQI